MGTVKPTTAVATISPAQLEEKIAALHGRLAEVEGRPNRYCVPRALAPSTVERRQLCAAEQHLAARLEPCHDKVVIEAVLSQFFIPYDTAREADPVSTESRNERYVKAVMGQPLGAIIAAVDRFDSASTILPAHPSFRPKPAEFAAEVKAGLSGLRKKLVHVRRILAAEVYDPPTPEQRAEVERARASAAEFLQRHRGPALESGGAYFDKRTINHEPLSELAAEREEREIARQIDGLRASGRGPGLSHLMERLDRKRVSA